MLYPEHIRKSAYLTGNHLGMLGNIAQLPDKKSVNEFKLSELSDLFLEHQNNPSKLEKLLAETAIDYLNKGMIEEAWKTLLAFNPR